MNPSLVLVTRPEPGATATAERLIRLGHTPIAAPMLEVQAGATNLPPTHALQAVLVTSANALPALPPRYHSLSLLAVGSATAQRARDDGFSDVRSADGDARDLAALALSCCHPTGPALLLATGAGHGTALAARLRDAGFSVLHASVYRTQPATALPPLALDAWRAGDLASALFFSAETARVFVRLITQASLQPPAATIEAIAIGPAAAAALSPLPWRRVRVADTPDQDAMLALLT